MKTFLYILLNILVTVAVIAICLITSRALYNEVINSNMPDWLKYVILK